jgi:transposase
VAQPICGVDVSSTSLEASIGHNGSTASFPNTPEGIAELAVFCHQHEVTLVAMEATGGYERQAWILLSHQGLGVAILNPRAVRQFASGMGRLEKTDRIDAAMIAWFAQVKRATPTVLSSASHQQLRSLSTRLRQITALRTAQLNQQRLVGDPAVQSTFAELLLLLNRQIKDLATQIAALLNADPLWREMDLAFRSIRGVAARTVARVLAEMPEIGTLSHKAISKLAGLAPLANDSGKYQGRRPVRGGRGPVREILFIVASVAGRYEPDFILFRQRLAQQGKPPKVIRIALAHKLLIRLNAKARDVRQTMQTQITPKQISA